MDSFRKKKRQSSRFPTLFDETNEKNIKKAKDLDKSTIKTGKMNLYEIKLKNRIVKGNGKPTRGVQGNWHPETLDFLANSHKEAMELAHEHIKSYRMLGFSRSRTRKGSEEREIEIETVKRIA